jgi:hypothetical protein
MAERIATYKRGFTLRRGILNKRGLLGMCSFLTEEWGVSVVPEAVSEGGLRVMGEGYKSIRFRSKTGRWPSIPSGLDAMDEVDDTIFPSLKGCTTFLKAFEGAPAWTRTEISDVKIAFQVFCGCP